jgi:hypothetical protein
MYKKLIDKVSNTEADVILKIVDNLYIPKDESNRHYQAYLEWIAEGNTPEEAE